MAKRYFYNDILPFTAMVTVECTNVGLNTLFKAASLKGLSYYVFIAYTYAIAAILLLPVPFFFCRPSVLSRHLKNTSGLLSLNSPIFFIICLQGIIGLIIQIVGNKGIEYSSPTLASALGNLTPAFTFALAVIFRMEKLAFKTSSTQAKIIGTIVSISGALVVVLYKGPIIWSPQSTTISLQLPLASPESDWIIGGILLASQCFLGSVWYILQAKILRILPMELLVTFIYILSVAIISAPVGLIAERNPEAWRLKPDITLVAVLYSGFFGNGLNTLVHTWGIHLKGPLYVALFKPLSIVIAAVMSAIFLGDSLYLGCVIGAVIISMGFYAVLWGKANEESSSEVSEDQHYISTSSHSSIENVPLLQPYSKDP